MRCANCENLIISVCVALTLQINLTTLALMLERVLVDGQLLTMRQVICVTLRGNQLGVHEFIRVQKLRLLHALQEAKEEGLAGDVSVSICYKRCFLKKFRRWIQNFL